MILLRAETRSLRCELSEADIRSRRTALAEAEAHARATRWRIKVSKRLAEPFPEIIALLSPGPVRSEKEERYAAERLKQRDLVAQLKTATSSASDLVEELARGWELRDVRVEIRRDGREVVTLRTDTGELIDRRAASDDEMRAPGGDD